MPDDKLVNEVLSRMDESPPKMPQLDRLHQKRDRRPLIP